jgi:predicted ATPase
MIERLYIDNYRTFVNCEIKLNAVSLLLGPNGAGKTAVFDVLHAIQRFIIGAELNYDLFPSGSLTRWQTLTEQRFELDVRNSRGFYQYRLVLKHDPEARFCYAVTEELDCNGQPALRASSSDRDTGSLWSWAPVTTVQAYDDNGKVSEFPLGVAQRSAVVFAAPRFRHENINAFNSSICNMCFVQSCPPIMETDSREESDQLARDGRDFPSWYRYVSRHNLSRQADLFAELRHVIDGFDSLDLRGPADATATLSALIKPEGAKKPLSFKFGELSDGQRQLIVLYTLLFGVENENRILFLDEPDNYLSLREIQPWLGALMDAAGRSISQAVIVSHHPEIMDQLAREKGVWLLRDSGGPTRIETGRAQDTDPLKPSDFEARGW